MATRDIRHKPVARKPLAILNGPRRNHGKSFVERGGEIACRAKVRILNTDPAPESRVPASWIEFSADWEYGL